MSRQHKYRAWVDGKMIYIKDDVSIQFFDAKHAVDWMITDRVDGHAIYKHDSSYPDLYESNKLMQFTGLIDTNGKNIWEGDIVKHFVEFPRSAGAGEYINGTVSWNLWGYWEIKEYDTPLDSYLGDIKKYSVCVELIGNIHENPELLK